MSSAPKYVVGQQVWVHEPRLRQPNLGTVTKVGRTLVSVSVGGRGDEKYRIDTGRLNEYHASGYFIQTLQERADAVRITELYAELRKVGVEFRLGARPSLSLLEVLAGAVRRHLEVDAAQAWVADRA